MSVSNSNDQGVHDDDYGDLIPTFDENLLNSQQLIDRHQMRDNNYDCQRLMDVENKRSQMRDNDQGYQRLVEVGEDLEDVDDIGSNSPAPIIDNILEIQSVADGVNQRGGVGELHHPLIQAVEMDEINMDVDDGVSEASSIASDRLGDDIDNSLTEEQHLCRVVDDAEELVLQEQVLQDQIDEEQRLYRAVDATLIQNVRNISHDLSVALRDL
jgi:hypothetical protein